MSNANNGDISVCANCGKEGDNINNICNKCSVVKYCNASCKKKHRHKHKNDCEEYQRLATEKRNKELKIAEELHEKELFKQPPPYHEDCPICFILLPTLPSGSEYYPCCGKVICSGCVHAPVYDDQGNEVVEKKCPFCRTAKSSSDGETMERFKKRVEAEDALAMHAIAVCYSEGRNGYPQDYTKALELWHQAAELGYTEAYNGIGRAYNNGEGVDVDKEKANQYYKQAAIKGNVYARHNLGCIERDAGNFDRALKHYIIAAKSGLALALDRIKQIYSKGFASKKDYMKALQVYQEYLGEIKSDQRDKAAATDEKNRYY